MADLASKTSPYSNLLIILADFRYYVLGGIKIKIGRLDCLGMQ